MTREAGGHAERDAAFARAWVGQVLMGSVVMVLAMPAWAWSAWVGGGASVLGFFIVVVAANFRRWNADRRPRLELVLAFGLVGVLTGGALGTINMAIGFGLVGRATMPPASPIGAPPASGAAP